MKISVITVTYNCASTLSDTLATVAAQSHPDVEHIVVDGASTDGTLELLREEGTRVAKLISERDGGIYDALNKGMQLATGEVVGFMHADDFYASNDVLSRVAAVFADSSVDAAYGDLVYVDRNNLGRAIRYWKAGEFDRAKLSRGWMPPHPTFYARRSVYERFGAFDTSYRISADYESLVRFLFLGRIKVAYIPEVMVCMRVGGISNRSLRSITRKSLEDYRIMRMHGLGGLGALLQKNFGKLGQFWRHASE